MTLWYVPAGTTTASPSYQALFLLGEDEASLALLDAEELEMEALGKALEQ